MDNPAQLLWGVLFGAIGFGFLMYGRKQKAGMPLACGLALMIVPYLITNPLIMVPVCLLITVLPFFIKL
ncbi:MAG: hypothetical protein KJ950_12525 [Proteobacteria bacterium]|nr:hypothetical protein [Pseudomonadota bacterium]MBU1687570.1 hypothetical protein [Pseudomonadota bacterium]